MSDVREVLDDLAARVARDVGRIESSAVKTNPALEDEIGRRLRTLRRTGLIPRPELRRADDADRSDESRRYVDLEEVGRGSQATVYRARDAELGREVALKIFERPREDDSELPAEAGLAARLDHPGICRILDAGVLGGRAFVAMDWIDGTSLRSVIENRDPEVPVAPRTRKQLSELIDFFIRIARALAGAHANGVVHGDVKPDNIMVSPSRGPVLVDLGSSELIRETDGTTSRRGGSPAYMSPERLRGDEPSGVTDDVYALGVTMFECLTLERPFGEDTAGELRAAVNRGMTTEEVRGRIPGGGEDLAMIVATAMAPTRRARYRSADDLAGDLVRMNEGQPISLRRPTLVEKLRARARRHPLATTALTLALLLLPAGAALAGNILANRPVVERAEAIERRNRDELALAEAVALMMSGHGVEARGKLIPLLDSPSAATEADFAVRILDEDRDALLASLDDSRREGDLDLATSHFLRGHVLLFAFHRHGDRTDLERAHEHLTAAAVTSRPARPAYHLSAARASVLLEGEKSETSLAWARAVRGLWPELSGGR